MRATWKYYSFPVVSLILAVLLRYWVATLSERLAVNYTNTIILTEEDKFRISPTGAWQTSTLTTKRLDQTIEVSGQVAIIEGGLHVYYPTGAVNFEVTSLYGVDRQTRQNVSGYGEVNRNGLFLFPPHVQRIKYSYWDPWFVGERLATFGQIENLNGLQVYVFKFSGTGMDETSGYTYLADVPNKYLIHTDGAGTIWVEPLSGSVVDYEDSGLSYFVDPASGNKVADFNQWTEKYTPETQTAQFILARAARLRILVLEDWAPGGLALVGIFVPGSILFLKKIKARSVENAKG